MPPPSLADTNRESPSLLCSMAPSKNKGTARVGGKPSVKTKNRQIHKKQTTRNLLYFKPSLMALRNPARFNGAGTASVKAKNLKVDKKTTSSQKSKSHDDDDDDAGGTTSRKEAQPGIWKQQPHDDIPDVIMNNNNTQHDIPPLDINEFRCTCPGSDGLSSCPRYRLPRIPTFYDDDDDDYLLDTMAVYH